MYWVGLAVSGYFSYLFHISMRWDEKQKYAKTSAVHIKEFLKSCARILWIFCGGQIIYRTWVLSQEILIDSGVRKESEAAIFPFNLHSIAYYLLSDCYEEDLRCEIWDQANWTQGKLVKPVKQVFQHFDLGPNSLLPVGACFNFSTWDQIPKINLLNLYKSKHCFEWLVDVWTFRLIHLYIKCEWTCW